MRHYIAIFLTTVSLLVGCARGSSADEVEKKKWQDAGWSFQEVVGTPVSGAESVSHLSSDTARSISAFAFDGSQRSQREYLQTERLYLVVTMSEKSGKTYSLIFTKERRANQRPERNAGAASSSISTPPPGVAHP
jgi:hypothetical protein